MQEAWLDIMPVIPLDRGVPVVWLGHEDTPQYRCVYTGHIVGGLISVVDEDDVTNLVPRTSLRVDLESPGGLAHALRWVAFEKGRRAGVRVDDVLLPLKPDRHYRLLVATRCVEMAG